ncbi:MAG TPA: LptF/LptG family permease [Bacteroidales bacterium]|nr:LptF/LptG family permease [Bacteroidales bacterium]
MKKIDLFMLRSFIGPLVLTFFIVLIIFILQFLWMYVDELAGKGLEIKVLAELLFQFSLTFVPLSLPLAILLASLMTFGNLGEFMELTALKSSGIPLQRIMLPLFVLVGFLSVASFLFADYILPMANRRARTLLYDIRRKRPELDLQAGTFYNGIDGFSIKITDKDAETNRLDRVYIYDHRKGLGNTAVIYADSGYMVITPDESGMILKLFNGYSYNDLEEKNVPADKKKYPFRRDRFSEQTMVVQLTGFGLSRSGIDLFRSNYAMLNTRELGFFVDSLSERFGHRSSNYYEDFSKTKLYTNFSYSGMPRPPTVQDTGTVITSEKFNCRAIFDTLPQMEKMTSVNRALNSARDGIAFLSEKSESLTNEAKNLKRYEAELYKKFTLPIACLVFFFIGAPLGAIIRKGGLGTPAVISVLFFIVYYVISLSGEKFAKELIISVPLGMFASTIVLLPIGIFLTYKATTDAAIMNAETYILFFRKIGAFFTGIKTARDNEDTGPVI